MAAFAEITPIEAGKNIFSTEAVYATMGTALATNGATTAAFGAYFTMSGEDSKYMILLHNGDADGATDLTVTIKAGNGLQGVNDISKTNLGNGEFTVLTIESGKFKNVTGNKDLKELSSAVAGTQVDAKGKVFITGTSAEILATVFKLT